MHTFLFAFIFSMFSFNTNQNNSLAGLTFLVKEPTVKSDEAPLLIMLHGYGSNAQDLFGLSGYIPAKFRVLSVQAPIALSQGSYAWYHLDMSGGKPKYSFAEAEKSRKQIAQFIDEAKLKYKSKQVHLLGFSQGAIMSYSVAFTQPEKVKSIVALSGRVLQEVSSAVKTNNQLQQLNVFIGHGKNDNVLPIHYGKEASDVCTRLKVKLSYNEYNMAHEINQQELNDIVLWLNGH